jgi:hypothetical protein
VREDTNYVQSPGPRRKEKVSAQDGFCTEVDGLSRCSTFKVFEHFCLVNGDVVGFRISRNDLYKCNDISLLEGGTPIAFLWARTIMSEAN